MKIKTLISNSLKGKKAQKKKPEALPKGWGLKW